MTRRQFHPADPPFFAEVSTLGAARARSLPRARALGARLGVLPFPLPVLTVVGSKGKGTAVAYASATLAAAGLRVGTVTSPPFLSNLERVRVNGHPVTDREYTALSERVAAATAAIGPPAAGDGYLSPGGLYTLAGARHFLDTGCDVVVLEAGLGGTSDEVSLFWPTAVAATRVFDKDLPTLGVSVEEAAEDELGVLRSSTAALVTVPQVDEVAAVARRRAAAAGVSELLTVGSASRFDPLLDPLPFPPALGGFNARAGVLAACALLSGYGWPLPEPAALAAALASVRLPGRLSVHERTTAHGQRQQWVVDCPLDGVGVAAALAWHRDSFGEPTAMLVCAPDHADVLGVQEVLLDRPAVLMRTGAPGLQFTDELWDAHGMYLDELNLDSLGERVLAVGTITFAADALGLLEVDCGVLFTAGADPARRPRLSRARWRRLRS